MNLKCFFGFHDYGYAGIYWIWANLDFEAIYVMQEYKCVRCGDVYTEILQSYPLCRFNIDKILCNLKAKGILDRVDYVIEKRDALVSESKGGNA